MARRTQKAASWGPAQRHNEVIFKIERPERSGPTVPRCAARYAALRPPRWCTPPMRCEACTNTSASCDVGYLAGFRQEGRHFWSMVDRSVPKGGSSSAPFSQLSPPLWQVSTPRRQGCQLTKREAQVEFSVGIFSHKCVEHLNLTVRRSGAILRRKPRRTFHQLVLFCSVASPWPTRARGARISRSAPACLRRDGGQHPPDRS